MKPTTKIAVMSAALGAGLMLAMVTLIGAAAIPAIKNYYLNYVLDRVQINDTHPPKDYWRCPAELCGERTCGWVDESRRTEVARFGWTTLNNRIYMFRAQFPSKALSLPDMEICKQGLPAYRVLTSTNDSRPLFDGSLYESTRDATAPTWKKIGTVTTGTLCEDPIVRKTTVEYHYATSDGLRGLAACGL